MIKLTISCLNVSLKKLIVWLQLHPKLIASNYITTGRPLGRTKAVHSCVTPKGTWSGGSEAWLPNPSSLTYFNRNGRVRILGKTSWYDTLRAELPSMKHYNDIIIDTMASQITSLTIVYSTVYSGAYQSKHQSSASLAFVWGIHRGPVNSLHNWPVTRKMFPFDDVIMEIMNYNHELHLKIPEYWKGSETYN